MKTVIRLSNLKVLPKLIAVIAVISMIVGACVWYAQGRMREIDQAYSDFLSNETVAAVEARRLNRLMFELNYWVYRIIAETEEAQMQSANRGFEAALPKVRPTIEALRAHAPTFAKAINAQGERIERFVQNVDDVRRLGTTNQNDKALALVHSAIDPTFSAMIEAGNKIADDIGA
ncbi:MAG: MCP four helix bundle domain-containing protein, partial [Actinomycetospora chiangmaiensis]|nr:MCP four helix bundle domain-containing protein [Actinomycetospora chiangmaiensis]